MAEKLDRKKLEEYRINKAKEIELRKGTESSEPNKYHILVCGGTACESNKSDEIVKLLKEYAEKNGIGDQVLVVKTGCFGFCSQGPVVKIMPGRVFYTHVGPEHAQDIIEKHIMKGELLLRILYKEQREHRDFSKEINFYQKQRRIVLKNCGIIDPENIDEYIGNDGYKALSKVLFEMTPDDVIHEMQISGLRGRGGAGFPTWKKWSFTKEVESDQKYIVCNADEGDPGAYMDRSILEGDPHSVIEAMTIAAYTIGANKGYLYIRAEYGLAVDRVQIALKQAYDYGLLGKKILGSDFSFDLDIRLGAGAFVCGEETALIASIEGNRGTPRPRPPFPAIKGLFEKPTVINNVETFANVTAIINHGGNWFSSIGTENSKGTKVFALTGNVNVSGLVEVPMGTTIREIVFDIGGGIPNDKFVKGVQTGGPSGGIIPESLFGTHIDFDNLVALGSMMGSGGMIVIDEDTSMVDFSKFYLGFCVDESCGKCVPCRVGGMQMLKILEKFTKKRAKEEDIQKLKDIALTMRKASLCALGSTAPNPVMSTLKHFEEEYKAGIFTPPVPKKN
ncbi:NADH dehydrogenase [Brachyspira hampsonii]|uniref:NADH dehydrogenase n=1 Tax=Brachyspira hampsonii TaxID=1287055 RepID=A0A1E5NFB6_9SPIR|nr:NuoF family protein [Brachyspira hampsonii]OEJ14870.1 NADH dehydrogenase [Brachyspira hampsonii]